MGNSVSGRESTVSGMSHRESDDAQKCLFTGDIVSVEIPGLSVLILNSYEAVQEFLSKRPSTTSGRKIGYMVLEL
jgi:hypothetical protein